MAFRATTLFLAGTPPRGNGINVRNVTIDETCSTNTVVDAHPEISPSSTVSATSVTNSLLPGITLAPTHAPYPSPNIAALPTEFSDIFASVVSCWDAQANYSTTSSFLYHQIQSALQYSQSLYPSGYVSLSKYLNEYASCRTTILPSLTTLCDGYPRASTVISNSQTLEETYTWSFSATDYYFTPSWSTELDQLPSPTCTPASDFGPVCSRLKDAYSWRVSNLQAQPSATGSIATPGCTVLIPTASDAAPKCHLERGKWKAFYWPTLTPSAHSLHFVRLERDEHNKNTYRPCTSRDSCDIWRHFDQPQHLPFRAKRNSRWKT